MIFLICIQNVTTIGPVGSEITCLKKMDTDRQTDKQTERGKHFFRTLEVITHRENMKVAIRLMDSITTHYVGRIEEKECNGYNIKFLKRYLASNSFGFSNM